ncbi:DNA-binding protein [Mucor mucedo]|uniref:DNA-binding protein n=1 Tax=Mucor mucedo TaxID=29922 RepID=UPI00221EA11D|nr:DNA-binding protein [Mucor mucedo]KAI7876311.1 DNA-binding protein [Mucor mucedo]
MTAGEGINSSITLEGSSSLVVDYFQYCLSSILMLRGLKPEDSFRLVTRYGLKVYISNEPQLTRYIQGIVQQLKIWVEENVVSRFIVAIISTETMETIERWQFNIQVNGENGLPSAENVPPADAEIIQKQTRDQIRSVLRQIVQSVSYLPELDPDFCTMKVLVIADDTAEVPAAWVDDKACVILKGAEHVQLRSVSTLVHNVDAFVAYKYDPF